MRSRLPVLSLLAVIAAVVVTPAEAHGASAKKGERVVLSPRAGEVVRSHVVRLRVRAGERARLRARLNGVDVSGEFGRVRRGVRTLRASVSHGLRHGRNVLRVRVHRLARPARRVRVRFVVRRSDPLVGAGRDRTVVVGEKSRLFGREVPRHGTHRASTRWRLVGGPRRGASAARAARSARLSSAAGHTAGLKPRAPGSYTVKFTSGTGENAISDWVTIDAVEDGPLVPIDTHAKKGGKVGVEVGGRFYAGGADGTVQLLQLDRTTLRQRQNVSYPSATDADVAAIKAELAGMRDDVLVVAVMRGKPARLPDATLYTRLGVPKDQGKVFSVIGVPGLAEGEGDYIGTGPGGEGVTDGRMTGYLTRDTHDHYGFVPDKRETFAYGRAPVTPCGAGDLPFGSECAGDVGFRLTVRDGHTLAPTSYVMYQLGWEHLSRSMFFNTNGRGLTDQQKDAEAHRMIRALEFIKPNDVVTIQAAADIKPGEPYYPPPIGRISRENMKTLARAVMNVGGSRSAFNAVAQSQGGTGEGPPGSGPSSRGATYILVGWEGAGEGNGAEAASWVDNAGGAPELSGVLRPNEASFFRPTQVKESLGLNDTLGELILRPPTSAWPLDDDPGAQRAIAYLGPEADKRLGSNPRSAYWTQGFSEATTDSIVSSLKAVKYPHDATFTKAEFDAARDQLVKELSWVGAVRTYLDNLSQPFSANETLKSWSAAQGIADKVYEDAYKPKDEAAVSWIEFTATLLHALGPITHEASGVLGSALELGMWIYGATESGAPSDGEVRREANKVGEVFVNRADIARSTFESMGDVIVSDYQKLKLVGTYGGCAPDPKDPSTCPKEWAFSKAARNAASEDVFRGVERYAYEQLLPLGYHVFALPQVVDKVAPPPWRYLCSGVARPFENYPGPAIMSLLQEYDPAGKDHVWDTYALSTPPGALTQHGTPPSAELRKKLFDPPAWGGLGISPTRLMRSAKHDRWGIDCRWWWL
jgi:hypothetical protein